jgi:hypothetical protein
VYSVVGSVENIQSVAKCLATETVYRLIYEPNGEGPTFICLIETVVFIVKRFPFGVNG